MQAGQKELRESIMCSKVRRIGAVAVSIIILIAAAAAVINIYMVWGTKGRILKEDQWADFKADGVVVLGCSVKQNGEPSKMLRDRMQTAVSFYKKASVPKMLVSGDNLSEDYDEVSVMKSLAVLGGIADNEVYMDHTGLNTYDTIVHSREFFGEGATIVIVTQSYHLYRALYLAEKLGLNAYGVSADVKFYIGQLQREIREILARVKDFWYGWTKPQLPEQEEGIITCKSKKFDVYYA